MVSFEYRIKDIQGVHARAATELFKLTKNYESKVTVAKGEKELPFDGVMKIMWLGVKQGEVLKISIDGPDEIAALTAIKEYVETKL